MPNATIKGPWNGTTLFLGRQHNSPQLFIDHPKEPLTMWMLAGDVQSAYVSGQDVTINVTRASQEWLDKVAADTKYQVQVQAPAQEQAQEQAE